MKQEFTKKQLEEIEKQLSCPTGVKGIEIANSMNLSNISMTKNSIDALKISNSNRILEVGHGNCGHLIYILNKATNINYIGLEISETMMKEALLQLDKQQRSKNISFQLYDGEKIPFRNNYFDKIFTVNTLYFWKNPINFLAELSRVLKKDGICIITFAQKKFMQSLPFVNNKFKLYSNENIKLLLKNTVFTIVNTLQKTEQVKSKSGNLVNRKYTLIVLKK